MDLKIKMLAKVCAKALALAFTACLILVPALGDVIETRDGARLVGRVTGISGGNIQFNTAYAGDIQVRINQIASIVTDDPLIMELETGAVLIGPLSTGPQGELEIASREGVLRTALDEVTLSWRPGDTDPRSRRWEYEAAIDLSGRAGNTDASTLATRLQATLRSREDSLRLYVDVDRAEQDGVTTADRMRGGMDYASFFYDRLGWYVRGELETDEIAGIDFRSTVDAGLTYRLRDLPRHQLRVRAGAGYRYETFVDDGSSDSPVLSFGAFNSLHLGRFGRLLTDLQYLPNIEDFGDYRIIHDSGLEVPVAMADFWRLRLGLAHSYNSVPPPGRRSLDTSYYVRLILSWR